MTGNTNFAFISNGVLYTYKYENTGSYTPVSEVVVANDVYDFNVSINTTSISISNNTANISIFPQL